MKVWEIWCEGWTGHESEYGLAIKLGEETADSFQSACDQFFVAHPELSEGYRSDGLYYCDRKLHDNENGAREFERGTIYPVLRQGARVYRKDVVLGNVPVAPSLVLERGRFKASVNLEPGDRLTLREDGNELAVFYVTEYCVVIKWARLLGHDGSTSYVCGYNDLLNLVGAVQR